MRRGVDTEKMSELIVMELTEPNPAWDAVAVPSDVAASEWPQNPEDLGHSGLAARGLMPAKFARSRFHPHDSLSYKFAIKFRNVMSRQLWAAFFSGLQWSCHSTPIGSAV
jgi:hypothetical protein